MENLDKALTHADLNTFNKYIVYHARDCIIKKMFLKSIVFEYKLILKFGEI